MSGKEPAFGGVVIDADGRILLREPAGHYDGYVWTFPKGRPGQGETEEETARRETWEETGVTAEIVARIPGTFCGGITENTYFLMRPTAEEVEPPNETTSVCWAATADKARAMLGETTNAKGRSRDLAVLDAALVLDAELRSLPGAGG